MALGSIGCSEVDAPDCVMGTVIGKETCFGFTLIQLEQFDKSGKPITYYDGKTYDNVVKVLYERGITRGSSGYYKLRPYDRDRDMTLLSQEETVFCPAIYGPLDVPAMVVTGYSAS